MKVYLEVITIAHPGEGSGRAANVTHTMTEVATRMPNEIEALKEGLNETCNTYETVLTRGGGKVEIFRNIIAV